MRLICAFTAALSFVLTQARAADTPLVTILEGAIKDKSWDLSKAEATDAFPGSYAAFGLVDVPKKYSSRGVALERSSPYIVRLEQEVAWPAGSYTLLVRSRSASRLYLDDKLILEVPFVKPGVDGHENVRLLPAADHPGLRPIALGLQEKRESLQLDGKRHRIRWDLVVGGQKLRAEVGEAVVAVKQGDAPYRLLSANPNIPYSDESWLAYEVASRATLVQINQSSRLARTADERAYWDKRHQAARDYWKQRRQAEDAKSSVDRFIKVGLDAAGIPAAARAEDAAFLRRAFLDTVGAIPTLAEQASFWRDPPAERRARLVDRLLADARWADHWISYWQDVLAENPGILKPTLNNTGPFRWWLHEALLDNLPMDRLVTQLVRMEGSVQHGAPAGFALATENDVPMAAKAQTLARAFLAADLSCARCHDAPSRSFKQEQLFSMAALLERKALAVPLTSSVKVEPGGRVPAVKVTLEPGTKVQPAWHLQDIAKAELAKEIGHEPVDSRERLAAILTSPANERFGQVLANRVWKRLMGLGLVEPVDDWRKPDISHPDLLQWLGRELITHDYDLKHLTRLILGSEAYQRRAIAPPEDGQKRLFAGPYRRRMSAEQLVDSLFTAAGKGFDCEELTLDPEGRMSLKQSINLGKPTRAWHFTSLANERDRPALALPGAQPFVDVLQSYGWRDARPSSQTTREEDPTPLQSMVLANGFLHNRIARLSDDSAFTKLCLEEQPVGSLVRKVYQQCLSRQPTGKEARLYAALLLPGFEGRRTGMPASPKKVFRPLVSWSNHLSPDATRLKYQQEQEVRAGDPPTPRLEADWRSRMEDMIWSLCASAEFAFVP